MHKFVIISLKATIINVIAALLFTIIILGAGYNLLEGKLRESFTLINTVAIKQEATTDEVKQIVKNNNKLENYPAYGTKYATMSIPAINVELPVYFGDTLEVLKNGAGHSSGSYFPGEGGSIIYMAHNSKNMLRNLGQIQIGDVINVTTSYGEFTYEVFNMKIVNETDVDELPIQTEKEMLMLYTCYPFNNVGYATQRYVVYANLVEN